MQGLAGLLSVCKSIKLHKRKGLFDVAALEAPVGLKGLFHVASADGAWVEAGYKEGRVWGGGLAPGGLTGTDVGVVAGKLDAEAATQAAPLAADFIN
jgi:hypothetical protein